MHKFRSLVEFQIYAVELEHRALTQKFEKPLLSVLVTYIFVSVLLILSPMAFTEDVI